MTYDLLWPGLKGILNEDAEFESIKKQISMERDTETDRKRISREKTAADRESLSFLFLDRLELRVLTKLDLRSFSLLAAFIRIHLAVFNCSQYSQIMISELSTTVINEFSPNSFTVQARRHHISKLTAVTVDSVMHRPGLF